MKVAPKEDREAVRAPSLNIAEQLFIRERTEIGMRVNCAPLLAGNRISNHKSTSEATDTVLKLIRDMGSVLRHQGELDLRGQVDGRWFLSRDALVLRR